MERILYKFTSIKIRHRSGLISQDPPKGRTPPNGRSSLEHYSWWPRAYSEIFSKPNDLIWNVNQFVIKLRGFWRFLLYPMRSMGESIGIGLEASSTSKGPQSKTTEPMDSTKVTYCSIQLGWILARDGFAKNAMGSRPEAKMGHFFI